MATEEINNYIKKRYERWLDYSNYHCSCAGIEDESIDVLNEVLCDLLQKPKEKLSGLLHKKSGQYTELDYFVLRMIKLNATSPTSPYRHKYKSLPVDVNVDYTHVEIEDVMNEDDYDSPGYILEKTNQLRELIDAACLSDYAKRVFWWRMSGELWVDWPGDETEKQLFDMFYKVRDSVREKLNNKSLF